MEGTLERARRHDLTTLRVLDVVESKRKGSTAMIVDEDGRTGNAWFWWYQAKVGELVVCAGSSTIDGVLQVGSEKQRGVVDRVPRDIVEAARRADPAGDGGASTDG